MPVFEGVETMAEVAIDFDVYCSKCGRGLCSVCKTVEEQTKSGKRFSLLVGNCPNCSTEERETISKLRRQVRFLRGKRSRVERRAR